MCAKHRLNGGFQWHAVRLRRVCSRDAHTHFRTRDATWLAVKTLSYLAENVGDRVATRSFASQEAGSAQRAMRKQVAIRGSVCQLETLAVAQ
jgi:hypothetical protein